MDFGRRAGDMLKSVYDTNDSGVVDASESTAGHKTSHQNYGADEIVATGLAGRINYVDRGDPAGWDKKADIGDFITDGTWRGLDLSGIVPAGALAINIRVLVVDNVLASRVLFRKPGNTNPINVLGLDILVVNANHGLYGHVACGADRTIAYWGSNLTFTTLQLAVIGWFI